MTIEHIVIQDPELGEVHAYRDSEGAFEGVASAACATAAIRGGGVFLRVSQDKDCHCAACLAVRKHRELASR